MINFMQYKRLIIVTLVTLSLAFNVFLAVQYTLLKLELQNITTQLLSRKTDEKALLFTKLFVDKFLIGQGTVDFEDRLKLENAVRDINDPEIFKQWQKFTASSDDRQAQLATGELFNLLLNRMEK